MTYNIRSDKNEVITGFVLKSTGGSYAEKYAVSENMTFAVNGDVTSDGIVDATDASAVLTFYAASSVG